MVEGGDVGGGGAAGGVNEVEEGRKGGTLGALIERSVVWSV